ncbi:hypothetical protein [Pontibacter litorisediminis]|uniref:hypothetical protein n=1 Tax=Pontibacter litorisediminis TaxID=1846260 RepID=UPI0023EC0F58|nr:hypothetical protein [Pontibacter litorisediminis]
MRDERENNPYYHEGLWTGRDAYDFNRDTRDGDFGKEHQERYRHGNNPQDFRNRRDFDANRFQNYPSRDHDMEDNYYDNTRGRQRELGNIRQGYGFPSFGDSADSYKGDMRHMQRERRAQQEQGYGSGRMSGYSGAAFGGSNYSAHGDFGGSSHYGSMSGGGGHMDDTVSSSGYGGGHSNNSMHPDRSTHSDRGEPNYTGSNRNPLEQQGYRGNSNMHRERGSYSSSYRDRYSRGSRRTDRGGYLNQDPNY